MTYTDNLEQIDLIISILQIFFLSLGSFYALSKNTNEKRNVIINITGLIIISIFCGVVGLLSNFMSSMICLIILLSILFSKFNINDIGYYFLISIICLSMNDVLFFISVAISYLPNRILNIQNNYTSFCSIIIIYLILVYLFFKIRRFRKGFSFLKEKLLNEYINILIFNISSIILFAVIIFTNYKKGITETVGIGIIVFALFTFITIQKSLQLYYKQKLLIQDLNETKEELENKKKEVEELEKENLNFSKISHSIAHKQKSLEYKLNTLMLKEETAAEIDLKDKLNEISKELQQKTVIELTKTNISEIDDMLSYMQSECSKNKIDFQLQLSGNIYHMINNHIDKEKLEILLADLIKNAIIAINYSENINKSILVRLGIIDGTYSLYVYDSGIEFQPETLENLGKKPSTTHAENGGTGMGMMNTFDTLKQYKASMIIHEYGKPSKDNFTKVIKIIFDKKDEFKIESYRIDKI